MKKVFLSLLCLFLITGCNEKKEKEDKVIETSIEKAKKEAAEISAACVIDNAKYAYMDSLLSGETITSGEVKELDMGSCKKASSGTWSLDVNTGNVTILDVVLDDYICNGTYEKMNCLKK